VSEYPEHEKLRAIKEQSQALGEFLDFSRFTLCEFREAGSNGEPPYVWTERALKVRPDRAKRWPRFFDFVDGRAEHNPAHESWDEGYVPVMKSIEAVLAEWFGIDRDKIDAEKRQMLDRIREVNA
jgi:hypothetical protein